MELTEQQRVVLQQVLEVLLGIVETDRRSKAVGLPQVLRRLPTVAPGMAGWHGSFFGLPDDWLDRLKPTPLKVRVSLEPEQPWSAMRICLHPKDTEQRWGRRQGRCRCKGRKGNPHPYYSPCWETKMVRLPDAEPVDTSLGIVWKQDKRNKWGGYYIETATGVRIGGYGCSMPVRKAYTVSMTSDDMALKQADVRGKWAAWLYKPSTPPKVKPVATLALLRTTRFLRKQILQLRQDVLVANTFSGSN